MPVRLHAPAGTVGGIAANGRFHELEADGTLIVREEHVAALLVKGCTADEPATAPDTEQS